MINSVSPTSSGAGPVRRRARDVQVSGRTPAPHNAKRQRAEQPGHGQDRRRRQAGGASAAPAPRRPCKSPRRTVAPSVPAMISGPMEKLRHQDRQTARRVMQHNAQREERDQARRPRPASARTPTRAPAEGRAHRIQVRARRARAREQRHRGQKERPAPAPADRPSRRSESLSGTRRAHVRVKDADRPGLRL